MQKEKKETLKIKKSFDNAGVFFYVREEAECANNSRSENEEKAKRISKETQSSKAKKDI